jgi:fucose permease
MPVQLSAVKGPLCRRLGRDENGGGGLVAAFHLAAIFLMLAAGIFCDRWGVGEVLIVGSLLAALGQAALAVCRNAPQAFAAVLLGGAGLACLSTGSLVLMPRVFYPQRPTAALCVGCLAFTLGTVAAPALGNALVLRRGLRTGLLILALFYLLPGIAVALTGGQSTPLEAVSVPAWSFPPVLLAAGVALVAFPMERTMATWSVQYLNETGHLPALASTLAVNFWVGFAAGRLGAGLFLGENDLVVMHPELWILFGLSVVAAIVLGNMIGTVSSRTASVGVFLTGFCLGPVFPLMVGMALRLYPDSWGTAAAVINAGAALGGVTLLPLISAYGRR